MVITVDRYGIVTLRDGDWIAAIAPGIGMNTISLQYRGMEILRRPETLQELEENPCVYGIPLLLPPNRTAKGQFSFDEVLYCLPVNEPQFHNHLHGFLHSQPFSVTQQEETMVQGEYENQGEIFPFPYRIQTSYHLTRGGYVQEFLITNIGNTDMPLTFGLHTLFANLGDLRIPICQRWELDHCYIPTGKLLALDAEAQAYRNGMERKEKLVRGFYTVSGRKARIGPICYEVSGGFDQWVLWNGSGGQGFCAIEPLQGAVNCLNTGTGLLRLKPGESMDYSTTISLVSE